MNQSAAEIPGKLGERTLNRSLWDLGRSGLEAPRNPIGIRQATREKSFQLLLDASDHWIGPIQ